MGAGAGGVGGSRGDNEGEGGGSLTSGRGGGECEGCDDGGDMDVISTEGERGLFADD